MLRTFDELGYRQEQRFHFELGLLKLVHLRRLLPVEQVLSSMGATSNQPASRQPTPISTAKAPVAAAPATPSKPAFSPFEQDKNRRRYDGPQGAATALADPPMVRAIPEPAPAPMLVSRNEPVPAPVPVPLPAAQAVSEPIATPTAMPQASPSASSDGDALSLQRAAVDALTNARQTSAADALEPSIWTTAEGEVRVQTELSQTMLPIIINPDADKIARGIVRAAGLKLVLMPTTAAANTAAETGKPRAKAGSATAKALEHPMVQHAQRLFDAEIQTVIDLTDKT